MGYGLHFSYNLPYNLLSIYNHQYQHCFEELDIYTNNKDWTFRFKVTGYRSLYLIMSLHEHIALFSILVLLVCDNKDLINPLQYPFISFPVLSLNKGNIC